jgi:hypothetical protein
LNFAPPADTLYIGRAALSGVSVLLSTSSVNHRVDVIDVYWACGLDALSTSVQTVTGFPVYSRNNTTGTGLRIGFAQGNANLAAGTTLTVGYTNSAGVAGRTATLVLPTALGVAECPPPLSLQSGDTGVQSIQSFQQSAASGAAATSYLFLYEALVDVAAPVSTSPFKRLRASCDIFSTGLPKVEPNAALTFFFSSTSGARRSGFVELVYG